MRTSPSAPPRAVLADSAVNLAFVLNGMVTTLLGPILPALVARWNLADAQAGYFFTAQFSGNLIGVAVVSVLLPRARVGVSLGLGYLLAAVGVAGVTLSQWHVVLGAVLLYGIGLGLAIPASNLFISEAHVERRAAALSVLNFMWGIGAVVCPIFVAWAQRRATPALFLLALGAALAVTAAVTSRIGAAPMAAVSRERIALSHLFGSKFGVALAVMFFLYVGAETSLGGWVADLAKEADGPRGAPWVLAPSFFWGGLLTGRALAPGILRLVRERTLAVAGLALALAGGLVLVSARSVPAILAGSGIAGFGLAAIFPLTVALLARFGADERRAAGPMFALAAAGGAVLPWIVGETSTHTASLTTGFLVPLAAIVVLFALHAADFKPQKHLETLR